MMIERIARAMCSDAGFDPDEIMANDGPRWKYYVPLTRAALTAMLEPTEQMIASAWTVIDASKQKGGLKRLGPGVGTAEIYRAMIQAALGEQP